MRTPAVQTSVPSENRSACFLGGNDEVGDCVVVNTCLVWEPRGDINPDSTFDLDIWAFGAVVSGRCGDMKGFMEGTEMRQSSQ